MSPATLAIVVCIPAEKNTLESQKGVKFRIHSAKISIHNYNYRCNTGLARFSCTRQVMLRTVGQLGYYTRHSIPALLSPQCRMQSVPGKDDICKEIRDPKNSREKVVS